MTANQHSIPIGGTNETPTERSMMSEANGINPDLMSNETSDSDQVLNTTNNQNVHNENIIHIGTFPPEWLPDHQANSCMSCDAMFTLIRRRHHCRSCGKIFCSDCCDRKTKLAYLGNKEARVCHNCFYLIEVRLYARPDGHDGPHEITANLTDTINQSSDQMSPSSSGTLNVTHSSSTTNPTIHGVLKTSESQSNSSMTECNRMTRTSSENNQSAGISKQVTFSDGIRPGTDLSESRPSPLSPSSSNINPIATTFPTLTRQNKNVNMRKSKNSKSHGLSHITVCDELGYLPPIVVAKSSDILAVLESSMRSDQKDPDMTIVNGMTRFDQILQFIGPDGVVTFLLLKEFYLKVKLVTLSSSNPDSGTGNMNSLGEELEMSSNPGPEETVQEFWCFASEGLSRLGQREIVLVLDRDRGDSCIPRDVFKIYLTIHELALRRQSLENLGNLLFQDGLFNIRDTAGLLLVQHMQCQDLSKFVLPETAFLFAIVLQRWEVPWSKVFPVRLLLRLGHKLDHYPYPLVSYRTRAPVYYEVGHTIISILGDFRNFRYSITHVEGLKVMIMKSQKRVLIQLDQSCYQQFTKVLDSSSNEHVLAWSAYPFDEAAGHLISVQNDDGLYETVEFYNKVDNADMSFDKLDTYNQILGASFVIFSGALKASQSGQAAKISIVEDGLLIQLQSCTMSALKQAINNMEQFDIDCENSQDTLNNVNICWLPLEE